MIERLITSYGFPINMKEPLPFEVDITAIRNERELELWVRTTCEVAHKYQVYGFDFDALEPTAKEVIRFKDHRHAVEYKLRIEY